MCLDFSLLILTLNPSEQEDRESKGDKWVYLWLKATNLNWYFKKGRSSKLIVIGAPPPFNDPNLHEKERFELWVTADRDRQEIVMTLRLFSFYPL